jgi:steroid delta-isomerase
MPTTHFLRGIVMPTLRTVEQYLKALNAQDLDGIVALYTEDASIEDPVGTPVLTGKDAIRAFYSKATCIKLEVELLGDARIAGAYVAFPFAITLPTETGPMRMEVIDTFKLSKQGLITEMKAYWSEENCHLV